MQTVVTRGNAISPIDGRYGNKTEELSDVFSEQALMRFRLLVEVEYLIFLSSNTDIIPKELVENDIGLLRSLYLSFTDIHFEAIQVFEKKTNHDVKAVEYYLRARLKDINLEFLTEYVHIGRTSEDINNLAEAFILREGTEILINAYNRVIKEQREIALEHSDTPMLALTHGQPASPTTAGWEFYVFVKRASKYLTKLKNFTLSVKCNGATGGDNALQVTYPEVNWRKFSADFITHLNEFQGLNNLYIQFENNPYTTQIESHDTYAELFGFISILNTIQLDFVRDMWLYISRGVITQKPVAGEVGSSAMPQKINPIMFENAEGNFGLANAHFDFFRNKLPVSRMQRDLSDSTVERAFGTAYAHTLIALKNIEGAMKRIYVNKEALHAELDAHPEIISEAYQTILRACGINGGYELLMELVRGKDVTLSNLRCFVADLEDKGMIDKALAEKLYSITPYNYIGNREFD